MTVGRICYDFRLMKDLLWHVLRVNASGGLHQAHVASAKKPGWTGRFARKPVLQRSKLRDSTIRQLKRGKQHAIPQDPGRLPSRHAMDAAGLVRFRVTA